MCQGLNSLYWGWSSTFNRKSLQWVCKPLLLGWVSHPLLYGNVMGVGRPQHKWIEVKQLRPQTSNTKACYGWILDVQADWHRPRIVFFVADSARSIKHTINFPKKKHARFTTRPSVLWSKALSIALTWQNVGGSAVWWLHPDPNRSNVGSFFCGKKSQNSKKTSHQWTNQKFTTPKTNMDTQNDGLEKVTPFKNGNFWYLCWFSGM